MIYLVLYDSRGQCQWVARLESRANITPYLRLGFVEVDREEYDRCNEVAREITPENLANLRVAQDALSDVRTRQQPVQRGFYEPDRAALERLQNNLDSQLASITQAYLSGDLTIDQWQRRMQDAINAGNTASRILAVNGARNLTQTDLQAIERANEVQARFINRFRRELDNEERALSDNQIIARARQYSRSNTATFEAGYTNNVLGVTLPYQPSVRTCCGVYCKCSWSIRRVDGGFDCYWQLGNAEHCQTCINRNRRLNPLRVRNGVIQPFNPGGLDDAPYSC